MNTTVYIALGSNLGDRVQNFRNTIQILQENTIIITAQSRIYETTPMYETNQPRFLNMVIRATTHMGAIDLLHILKCTEKQVGRTKTYTNGPRVMDLDILYYGDLLLDTANLHIPHIRIHERQFVLQPMLDIAPDYMDCRTKKTIRQMADTLPADKNMCVYQDSL